MNSRRESDSKKYFTLSSGKTKVHSFFGRAVELIRRVVVSQPVPAVVGEPEHFGCRRAVESHRISNPPGVDLQFAAVRRHARNAEDVLPTVIDRRAVPSQFPAGYLGPRREKGTRCATMRWNRSKYPVARPTSAPTVSKNNPDLIMIRTEIHNRPHFVFGRKLPLLSFNDITLDRR